jgi:hypothetical protein
MLWNGYVCGEIYGNENLKATIPGTHCDRPEIIGGCGIFQLFG